MSGGYDTASTVATGWASAHSNGSGTPTFWLRYFSPCYTTPFNVSRTSANDECSSIWDINSSSPTLSPITVPLQSRLAGSTAEGQDDAQAFVSALTTVYDEVAPFLIPTNNQLYVWLDQEEAYGLSLGYWNGWATYVGLNDFGGDTAEPLYPCLYCNPDAPSANCSTIQNGGASPLSESGPVNTRYAAPRLPARRPGTRSPARKSSPSSGSSATAAGSARAPPSTRT